MISKVAMLPIRVAGSLGGRLLRAPALVCRGASAVYTKCIQKKPDDLIQRLCDKSVEIFAAPGGYDAKEKKVLLLLTPCVASIISQLGLLPSCLNDQNQKFLFDKILQILSWGDSDTAKPDVIRQVVRNFTHYLTSSVARIEADIAHDPEFRTLFKIAPGDKILHVTILGDETHNKGKTPLCIELKSGRKFVFKPRSMITEKLLCGNDRSALALVGFKGIYPVYDRGSYGYCSWLENNETENSFESEQELAGYYSQFVLADAVCSYFSITDLHNGNVIADKKQLYLTDTEVRLPPFCKQITYLFDVPHNGISCLREGVKNVYRAPEKVDIDNLLKKVRSTTKQFHEETIEKRSREFALISDELDRHTHRLTIIGTAELVTHIQHPHTTGPQVFCEILAQGLKHQRFVPVFDEEVLRKQFLDDCMNNDVPIFYYSEKTGEARYGTHVIGVKSPSSSSGSSSSSTVTVVTKN